MREESLFLMDSEQAQLNVPWALGRQSLRLLQEAPGSQEWTRSNALQISEGAMEGRHALTKRLVKLSAERLAKRLAKRSMKGSAKEPAKGKQEGEKEN